MTIRTVLFSCNPNRHGTVRLVSYEQSKPEGADPADFEPESIFVVESPGHGYVSDDGGSEFTTQVDARREYDAEVKRLSALPNWKAQAEYDEEWGTDNGYGRHQFNREY